MRTISVGELRQNPTRMLEDIAAGEVYILGVHDPVTDDPARA